MHSFVDQLISSPRQLSDELLTRLYIYSRTDKPGHSHALFHHSRDNDTTKVPSLKSADWVLVPMEVLFMW